MVVMAQTANFMTGSPERHFDIIIELRDIDLEHDCAEYERSEPCVVCSTVIGIDCAVRRVSETGNPNPAWNGERWTIRDADVSVNGRALGCKEELLSPRLPAVLRPHAGRLIYEAGKAIARYVENYQE